MGDNLAPTYIYHLIKFHRPASTHAGATPYKIFCEQTYKRRNTETYSKRYPKHAY